MVEVNEEIINDGEDGEDRASSKVKITVNSFFRNSGS